MSALPYSAPSSAQQWAMDYLSWIGAPASSSKDPRVQWLVAQERQEGNYPGTTNYQSEYNPLDTSMPEQGSRSVNSSNVQGYGNLQTGLLATQQTMQQPYDSPIFNALRNQSSSLADLQSAQAQSNWAGGGAGSAGNKQYAIDISHVLGSNAPTSAQLTSANVTGGTSGVGVGFLHTLQAMLNPNMSPSLGANPVKDVANVIGLPATDAGKIALFVVSRGGFVIIGGLACLAGAAILFVNFGGGPGGTIRSIGEVQRIAQAPRKLTLEQQRANTAYAAEQRRSANANA